MKDAIKEQMQAGIDNCSNTISFDEFDAKAEEAKKLVVKTTRKEGDNNEER